jgi:hypothetical protein
MDQRDELSRTQAYLSTHARARARQRGTSHAVFGVMLEAADQVVPIGGACVALGLSRRAAAEARAEGVDVGLIERARRRALVVGENGTIVTVLVKRGARGRRYSRRHAGVARERLRARGRR